MGSRGDHLSPGWGRIVLRIALPGSVYVLEECPHSSRPPCAMACPRRTWPASLISSHGAEPWRSAWGPLPTTPASANGPGSCSRCLPAQMESAMLWPRSRRDRSEIDQRRHKGVGVHRPCEPASNPSILDERNIRKSRQNQIRSLAKSRPYDCSPLAGPLGWGCSTLTLSGRQRVWGGGTESRWQPVHSRGLFDNRDRIIRKNEYISLYKYMAYRRNHLNSC